MANELDGAVPEFDRAGLYREEAYTDRKVGTIRCLVPVTESGDTDADRPMVFMGQTQILTPAGALPLNFEIPGGSLAEAASNFGDAAQKAVEETSARLEELRHEAASSIIVPNKGQGPAGGFGAV